MKYPYLAQPGTMGTLKLANRYVMTAMGTFTCKQGVPTEKTYAYYAERARGGMGLIITEVTSVKEGSGSPGQLGIWKDDMIPAAKKLADTIHAGGAKAVMQLMHPGARSPISGPLPTPSGITAFGQPGREMTIEEVQEMVALFAEAALRTKKAGFDGVELHSAHNYLLHNFLSPHFNHRKDQYGGSFENRFRFLKEMVEQVRDKVGKDYPLLVRISADEYLPDGQYLDEGIKIAMALDALGVDAIDVSVGGASNGRSHTIEPMSYAEGWRKHLPKAVKTMVKVPVIATTVIRTPAFAEKLLAEGYLDFVGSGRNNLADPAWYNKAQAGREEDICPCISCCRCIESLAEGAIQCSVNPLCGREDEEPSLVCDGAGKTALVVGGGPAGMEAAMTLAKRGFAVTLYEKNQRLGGQMALASAIPFKDKMLWYVDWARCQMANLGVKVKLNAGLAAADIKELNPDLVIDATGAEPIRPETLLGSDLPNVKTPVDILSGAYLPKDKHVAVIGSGLTGLETAELLAEAGNMVKVIEMAGEIAPGGSKINTGEALRRLNLANVPLQVNRRLTKIEADRIYLTDTQSGEDYVLPVDVVVLSLGVKATTTLAKDLQDICPVYTVGDAAKSGRIREAVLAGHLAALEA